MKDIINIPKARLTMTEAGAIASVSAGTIQKAIKGGLLRAYTKRRPYYILYEDLMEFIRVYLS